MSFAVYLAALFFAPLAFGTTEAWSAFTLELLVILTGLCWFLPFYSGKAKAVCWKVPGLAPLLLFIGWMCLQCVPLPVAIVEQISPRTVEVYQPALDLLPPDTWIPLTVSRQASLLECLRLSAYAFFYVLTVQLLSSGRRLTRTVTAVAVLAIALAFLSSLQRAVSPDTLFWFRKIEHSSYSFGPWVYRNQYAGFMAMTFPLALALFLLHRSAGWQGESFREKIIALFSGPEGSLHLLFGFGTLVALSSIFLSQSRGGIISTAFTALLFFLLLIRSQGKMQTLTLLLLTFCLISASAIGWFSWDAVLEKFSRTLNVETGTLDDPRLLVLEDAVRIVTDFPATGTGSGSFLDIFPSYKSIADKSIYDNLIYDHAHNDWLELLTDSGVIGFLLAAWFLGAVLKKGLRQIVTRQDRMAVLLSIAAFSGIAGALVFSLTDFNLRNGADGLYFFFLCGLLIAAGHTRQQHHNRPTLLSPAAKPVRARLIGFTAAILLLAATLRMHGGMFLAEEYHRRARNVSASMQRPEKKATAMAALIEQARKSNPFDSLHHYSLANLERHQGRDDKALELYTAAALLQPLEGSYLQSIAQLLANGDMERARYLMEEGYSRALQKDGPLRTWVEFELAHQNREDAADVLRNALQQNPALLRTAYPLLVKHGFSQEETAAILPELTSVWISYWNLARAAGREAEGRYFIEHALDYLDQEPAAGFFMQVYQYHLQQKQEERAIEVLREGIKHLPNHAQFHILLGDYYKRQRIFYRAAEEYEQARLLQPGNVDIQDRIKKLKWEQQL